MKDNEILKKLQTDEERAKIAEKTLNPKKTNFPLGINNANQQP